MPFIAECPFCRLQLQGVPEDRAGGSMECPRCRNHFTLAAQLNPRKARRIRSRSKTTKTSELCAVAVVAEPVAEHTSKPAVHPCGDPALDPSLGSGAPEEREPNTRKTVNAFGLASFHFGSVAFLAAALPDLGFLTAPLAGAGVLSGALGLAWRSARKKGTRLAAFGLAVSLPALLLVLFWPHVLGLPPWITRSAPAVPAQSVYHLGNLGVARHVVPKESEWVDASKDAIQQGGVRVRIAGVAVKQVELKDANGHRRSGERSLILRFRLSNAGADRLINYQSWGRPAAAGESREPKLTDDRGRQYHFRNIAPGWTVVGQVPAASLPLGKWVDDVLVFEPPSAHVQYLRLELPCAAFGASGTLQLEIPRAMIAFP